MNRTQLLNVKEIALMSIFASIYAIFSLWSLFPIIGAPGRFITLSRILSPLMGILLGVRLGVFSIALGEGILALTGNAGSFGLLSFLTGASSALFSALLCKKMRMISTTLFLIVLVAFTFFPESGPAWTFPYFIWLHLATFILMLSPILPKSIDFILEDNHGRLTLGLAVVTFISVLFSHLVGSLTFESIIGFSTTRDSWISLWQILVTIYPVERGIITLISTIFGVPLIRVLRRQNLEVGDVLRVHDESSGG